MLRGANFYMTGSAGLAGLWLGRLRGRSLGKRRSYIFMDSAPWAEALRQ